MATVGTTVFYSLLSNEAEHIQKQREVYKENEPPHGVIIHVGADVVAGQNYPMIVTAANSDGSINGQVILDGNDHLWVREIMEGAEAGQWQSTYTPPVEPPAPPTGEPTEMATVQWDVKETDTDIALTAVPANVVVGSVFLIEAEYMTVTGTSNPDNPEVERGTYGSAVAPHLAGVAVSIWSPPVQFVAKQKLQGKTYGKKK